METLFTIALKVAGELIIAIGAESMLFKIKTFFSQNYKLRLAKIIYDCMDEFENKYPYDITLNKFPFYHSQILLEKLLAYRLFDHKELTLIEEFFKKNKNILIPTSEQLVEFYSLFTDKVKKDKKLKQLYIKENYQEEIFNISSSLNSLRDTINEAILGLNVTLNKEYEDWLDKAHADIKSFKPNSAMNNLLFIEEKVRNKPYFNEAGKAKLHYLKGICYQELWEAELANKEFLTAHSLDSNNEEYHGKALLALVDFNEDAKAIEKCNSLLNKNEFNEIGHSVKVCLDKGNFEDVLKSVPNFILNNLFFKTKTAGILTGRKRFKDLEILFLEESKSNPLPKEINFINKDYWGMVNGLYLEMGLNESIFYLDRRNVSLVNVTKLKLANKISEQFIELFQDTEKINGFLNHKLIYHLTEYLIKGKESDAKVMLDTFQKMKKGKEGFLVYIIFSLCQVKDFDNALELINAQNIDMEPQIYFAKNYILYNLGKNNEAKEAFGEFVNTTTSVNDKNIMQFIGFMDIFLGSDLERKEFISELEIKGKLSTLVEKNLLHCYLGIKNEEKKEVITATLNNTIDVIPDNCKNLKFIVALFFNLIKEHSSSIKILNEIVDERVESNELKLLIENLYYDDENKDIPRLLRLLSYWRNNFTAVHTFLIWEINLISAIPDWVAIESVAKYAISKFPDNTYFQYSLIHSLYKQNSTQELKGLLSQAKNEIRFSQDEVFRIANIAVRQGSKSLAYELVFPFANNVDNKIAREYYFGLFGLLNSKEDTKTYDEVKRDLTVQVKLDGVESFIDINDVSLNNDPRTKNLLGKRIGEFVNYQLPASGEYKVIEIVGIYDKYQKLFIDIMEETKKNQIPSMSLQSIEFDDLSVESMTSKMMSMFGKESEFRFEQRYKVIEDYINRKLSFTQAVRLVFNDSPIDGYQFFTSNFGSGFHVQQIHFLRNIKIPDTVNFVLDITSLLLLYELYKEFAFNYNHKFYISSYILNYLYEELFKIQLDKENKMSLQITTTYVMPILYPEDYKQKQIDFLNDLIKWTENNTIRRPVIEKLNITTRLEKNSEHYDEYFETIIDTAFLADPATNILIADDTFYYEIFKNRPKIISTELYLFLHSGVEFRDRIKPFLLSKNYKGIQITYEDLTKAFDESFALNNSNYDKALMNIPYNIFKNFDAIDGYLYFIRDIYMKNTIIMKLRKEIALNVFVFIVKTLNLQSKKVETRILEKINSIFFLLPNYKDEAIHDLQDAIKIVYGVE